MEHEYIDVDHHLLENGWGFLIGDDVTTYERLLFTLGVSHERNIFSDEWKGMLRETPVKWKKAQGARVKNMRDRA